MMKLTLRLLASLIAGSPVFGQRLGWQKIDTVTSGDFNDHDSQLDRFGLESGGAIMNSTAATGEWMVFERDSGGVSAIAGKRFWLSSRTWDSLVTQIYYPTSGVVQPRPEVCSFVSGFDSMMVMAAWVHKENGVRTIYYSTASGNSDDWFPPKRMSDIVLQDSTFKLTADWSSILVSWRADSVVMFSVFNPDSISYPDTLVVSNYDSVQYDLNGSLVFWTFRDPDNGRILMAGGSMRPGLSPKVVAIDTIQSDGDIAQPTLMGGSVPFPTYEVQKADRVEGHILSSSSYPTHWIDSTVISKPAVKVTHLADFSLGYSTCWVWEEQSSSDTSIFFASYCAAGNPIDTDVFIGGSDPIMGPMVQIAHLFPLSSYSNVAVWQGSVNGRSRIYGRPFVVDIPDEIDESPGVVSSLRLYQNYPNPFNPTTEIDYSVPKNSFVTLRVYNVLGQEVATLFSGVRIPGQYQATFNASRFASGVYIYRLQAGSYSTTEKMLLLK